MHIRTTISILTDSIMNELKRMYARIYDINREIKVLHILREEELEQLTKDIDELEYERTILIEKFRVLEMELEMRGQRIGYLGGEYYE
jgi:hypothetical protein